MDKTKAKTVLAELAELDIVPSQTLKDAQGQWTIIVQDPQGINVNQVKKFADDNSVTAKARLIVIT